MHPHLNIDRTPMANKEGNSQMRGGKFDYEYAHRRRSRPFYQRRCKASLINLDYFPYDLVFEILLHLPAQDIHDGAKLVCKKWYKMIHSRNFIYQHLRQYSTPGIFIPCCYPFGLGLFVSMRRGQIQISKFSYKFKEKVFAGCNGFLLDLDLHKPYILHVVNPATKQRFRVPHHFVFGQLPNFYFSGMAYAAASMEYKVVHTYLGYKDRYSYKRRWAILTVGVDHGYNSWRKVESSHLIVTSNELLHESPFVTQGFVHWPDEKETCVFTVNVETETITQNPVPHIGYEEGRRKWFLSTGKSLSLLIACGLFSFDVWVMKSESGEWTSTYNIDLEPQKHRFEQLLSENDWWLKPVGWLKYEEVLVLHIRASCATRVCIAYNVRTQGIDLFDLDIDCFFFYTSQVHSSNLLSLSMPVEFPSDDAASDGLHRF